MRSSPTRAIRSPADSGRRPVAGRNPAHAGPSYPGRVPTSKTTALAKELARAVEPLESQAIATAIYSAGQRALAGRAFANQIAEMLANWHARNVELTLAVAEETICQRGRASFVLARPIFEASMSLAWVRSVGRSTWSDRYPALLTLLDERIVVLARQAVSTNDQVRERATAELAVLDAGDVALAAEARTAGARGLPDLRTRIKLASSTERDSESRLNDAYGFYGLLSEYTHPSRIGGAYCVGPEGELRADPDPAWDLLPLMITGRESPLNTLMVAKITECRELSPLAIEYERATQAIEKRANQVYRDQSPVLPGGLDMEAPGD